METRMKVKVEPLGAYCVVRPAPPTPYAGKVIAVELTPRAALRGTVLAVGPEVRDVRVGQRVLFSRLQGLEVEVGEPVVLLLESAVLAVEA
jgi:co-chaperonin GroES (HSP10)